MGLLDMLSMKYELYIYDIYIYMGSGQKPLVRKFIQGSKNV